MIVIIQAVQSNYASESLPCPSAASKSTTVKSTALNFKQLKNDALTDFTASTRKPAKDEGDRASDQAAENGLGLVPSGNNQQACNVQAAEDNPAPDPVNLDGPASRILELLMQPSETAATTGTTETAAFTAGTDASEVQASSNSSELLNAAGDMSDELLKGIADILEGYGLLKDGATAEDALQQAAQLLSSFYNATLKDTNDAAPLGADAMYSTDAVSNEAGTLNETTLTTMQAHVKELIQEYLCSLENTGNTSESPSAQTGTAEFNKLFEGIKQGIKSAAGNADKPDETDKAQPAPAQPQASQQAYAVAAPSSRVAQSANAAEQSSASSLAGKTDMAENISRIVESMSSQSTESSQEFTVALKPDHLGKLSIKLIMDSDGLKAHIKAADASVSGLIRSELNTLSDQLKEKGIQISQIDVTYDTSALLSDAHQGNGRQYSGSSKNRRTYAAGNSEPYSITATSADMQQLLANGSSVEFQA